MFEKFNKNKLNLRINSKYIYLRIVSIILK